MMLVVMNQIIASNLGKFRPFILGVFKTLLTPIAIFDFHPNRYAIQEFEDEIMIIKGIFKTDTMTFEKSSYTDIELRIAMVKSGLKSQLNISC